MERIILLKLLKEEGYPAHLVDSTIEKIERFQPDIVSAFSSWLSDGKSPSISVAGYSFSDLIIQYGMKPVGAFITLDWLTRDPEKATNALKRGIR